MIEDQTTPPTDPVVATNWKDHIVANMIVAERSYLRRALLTYRLAGRGLFVSFIIAISAVQPTGNSRWPLALAVVALALFWFIEVRAVSMHGQMLSRLVGETEYENSRLGALFIRVHHLRHSEVAHYFALSRLGPYEPAVWTVVALFVLFLNT